MRFLNPAQEQLSRYGVIPKEDTAYAGCDLKAVMYMPLMTTKSANGEAVSKIKLFADLQTLSISSTRSISPVRVFGQSQPIAYTKGAITYAGTMVFATLEKDAFADVYDTDLAESFATATNSTMAHQLPPFSIVVTLANEQGASAVQVIHGITITNYGTTYSINDIFTEQVFTYIATDVTPLLPAMQAGNSSSVVDPTTDRYGKNLSTMVAENLQAQYGKTADMYQKIVRKRETKDQSIRTI